MTASRTEHEWIIDYLNDRLSEFDREIFEQRLIDDPILLDHTHAVLALCVGLRDVQRVERSARFPKVFGVEMGSPTGKSEHARSHVRPADGLN